MTDRFFKDKILKPSILPGFKLTFAFTLFYLIVIVVIPLSGLFFKTFSMTFTDFWQAITSHRVLHAFKISFGISFIASCINIFIGLLVAWVLVRYEFFGKNVFNAIVDLPFALPTAIAGIALTALYVPNGWLGRIFELAGIQIAYTPLGITVALIFIGFPFIVRTVQPILMDMDKGLEEASASLGATRLQTFIKIILPSITPALLTGFAMAFARSLGEYGSVIFIAGNVPGISEIVPLVIVTKLEQYDYVGASAISTVMLVASFTILLLINLLQKRSGNRKTIE